MVLQMKQVSGLLTALKTPFNVSTTPPSNPQENEVWLDSDTMSLYIYMNDSNGSVWVEII